jgi:hypothetical protein
MCLEQKLGHVSFYCTENEIITHNTNKCILSHITISRIAPTGLGYYKPSLGSFAQRVKT